MMFISELQRAASKYIKCNVIYFGCFKHYNFILCRRARKILTVTELRRSARKPYRQLNSSYYVALSKTLSIPLASLPAQLQIQPVPQATATVSSTKATTGI